MRYGHSKSDIGTGVSLGLEWSQRHSTAFLMVVPDLYSADMNQIGDSSLQLSQPATTHTGRIAQQVREQQTQSAMVC